MASITLQIRPRGKPISKLPSELVCSSTEEASSLYNSLATISKNSVHRIRITKGSDGSLVPNNKNASVHSLGLRDQSTIYVKDLGPQIAWRTVFVIEYLGPLLIHPLTLFFLRPYLYRDVGEPSFTQLATCLLLFLHFAKREFETVFIHRFSNATMPWTYIFRNSAHYWLLSGVNMAYWIFSPSAPTATEDPNMLLYYAGLALFVFGELANFNTHLALRNLRRPGSTERGIPQGFGFGLVTCPNYLFEVVAWIGIYLVSQLSWSFVVFLVVATVTMASWAKKKERRYRKDFGDKYKKKRFAMLPYIY